MTAKLVRGALVLVASIAACLFVATPARAAQADILVLSAYLSTSDHLYVFGTVTCTQPTGAAHVNVMASQVMPFTFGSASVDVPCAAGQVGWEAWVYSSSGWNSWNTVSVNAFMTDDHGGSDVSTGTW
ncbi:hypothetical protein [Micromonospora okii]|uniref:hypothetical protein n=1 Tax=Micromonospora okii TaxID=1182970 RepID=UPI001E601E34|nr:hypothetical protein [Micromonospora okii]